MWRFGTTLGIKQGAGAWSSTSALPMTATGPVTTVEHAFDGGIFRVGFFWDWLNSHQCSYVTRADRRVEGLVAEGWVDGWGVRNGWIGGRREKVRGVYGFSSLMKQNKKAKNYAVFCFAGKKIIILYLCCDCEANFL
jgi:hypothetical protein